MNTSSQEREYWLDRPGNVDKIVRTLYALCGISVLFEFVIEREEKLAFAEWFAFYAWYGFVACVGLVLAAKALRRVLMRPEDYYTANEPGSDQRAANREERPE